MLALAASRYVSFHLDQGGETWEGRALSKQMFKISDSLWRGVGGAADPQPGIYRKFKLQI